MGRERRREFHQVLVDILGTNNVYFQPPESVKMTYPCIVYKRDNVQMVFADNKNYKETDRYEVIHITKDPDVNEITHKIRDLKHCSFNRHYVADNLYHDVYIIYY